MRSGLRVLCLVVALALAGTASGVDPAESREREQIRRLQKRVQQLQEEGDAARSAAEVRARATESATAVLKRELEASRAEARKWRDQARRPAAIDTTAAKERQAWTEARVALEARIRDLEAGLAEAQVALRDAAKARDAAGNDTAACRADLARRVQDLGACAARNRELARTGQDILDRYARQGLFSKALRDEPFLRLKRVELETELQALEERLEDQTLPAPAR